MSYRNGCTVCSCLNMFSLLDSSRTGRCSTASHYILPRRLAHSDLKKCGLSQISVQCSQCDLFLFFSFHGDFWWEVKICLTGASTFDHCTFASDMGQTRPGNYDVTLTQLLRKSYIDTYIYKCEYLAAFASKLILKSPWPSGGGCIWSYSHYRGAAWVQGGPAR